MISEDPSAESLKPPALSSEEQFVVALRRLRERSGLTFKEIEKRTARGDGLALPASTLATALHRRNVPRPEVVAALVRVCGGNPEEVNEWLALRESIVHPLHHTDAPAELTEVPQAGPRSRRRPLAAAAAVLVVIAAATAFALTRSPDRAEVSAPPASNVPALNVTTARDRVPPGAEVLKLGGLCLSEHEDDRSGRVYLSACAKTFPPRRLKPYGGVWRVMTDHPRFGPGCMGVVDGSKAPGVDMSDDTCDRVQTDKYTLRPVSGGYLLLPEGHDLCVGVTGRPRTGAKLKQLACDPRAPGQLFAITR